jgi:hypothetical protein
MTGGSGSDRTRVPAPDLSRRRLERRRSERLLLTIPIRVEGVDSKGKQFIEDTRTLVINREGARIYLQRLMTAGTIISISTLARRRKANFRVVGPTKPLTSEGGEWGVECLEGNENLWGIGFPPPLEEEGSCTALLECRQCRAVELTHLSLIEHDVLATSGLLRRYCGTCGRTSAWGYSERSRGAPPGDVSASPAGVEVAAREAAGLERRVHRRVALKLPVRIRNYYGVEEFAATENVSKSGLCFVSDKTYEIGEVLLVTCPYQKSGHNIEVRTQVIRRLEMQGTNQKIYGLRYEK